MNYIKSYIKNNVCVDKNIYIFLNNSHTCSIFTEPKSCQYAGKLQDGVFQYITTEKDGSEKQKSDILCKFEITRLDHQSW